MKVNEFNFTKKPLSVWDNFYVMIKNSPLFEFEFLGFKKHCKSLIKVLVSTLTHRR